MSATCCGVEVHDLSFVAFRYLVVATGMYYCPLQAVPSRAVVPSTDRMHGIIWDCAAPDSPVWVAVTVDVAAGGRWCAVPMYTPYPDQMLAAYHAAVEDFHALRQCAVGSLDAPWYSEVWRLVPSRDLGPAWLMTGVDSDAIPF